ncbi:uncharacterized protein TRIADDRAFT_61723 [Trichoplax adhaerens]|uniref:Uncharacterized protein n=1 Tax=Trichoplax adhaerens TaxID=10228 RepID=B3SBS9_TRIAD|nr:hypothetical protein TRIADDRAFT_61723 [Trichoplax adhaerens]EDV19808.1 hypothetical protein TRIADDRAFT_61723 [Trichoplax adhaerens]|eukprot:XP_002117678.1 hypothetical protein TRIADDRAFT_61723 [Trichoplax adhaerens]
MSQNFTESIDNSTSIFDDQAETLNDTKFGTADNAASSLQSEDDIKAQQNFIEQDEAIIKVENTSIESSTVFESNYNEVNFNSESNQSMKKEIKKENEDELQEDFNNYFDQSNENRDFIEDNNKFLDMEQNSKSEHSKLTGAEQVCQHGVHFSCQDCKLQKQRALTRNRVRLHRMRKRQKQYLQSLMDDNEQIPYASRCANGAISRSRGYAISTNNRVEDRKYQLANSSVEKANQGYYVEPSKIPNSNLLLHSLQVSGHKEHSNCNTSIYYPSSSNNVSAEAIIYSEKEDQNNPFCSKCLRKYDKSRNLASSFCPHTQPMRGRARNFGLLNSTSKNLYDKSVAPNTNEHHHLNKDRVDHQGDYGNFDLNNVIAKTAYGDDQEMDNFHCIADAAGDNFLNDTASYDCSHGANKITDVIDYIDKMTTDSKTSLVKKKHYCGIGKECIVYVCSRGKCRGSLQNANIANYCPYGIKLINNFSCGNTYRVKVFGQHNHKVQEKDILSANQKLHGKVKKWITACLLSGMSIKRIFKASIDQENILSIGRIPICNVALKGLDAASAWHPSINQIAKVKKMVKKSRNSYVKLKLNIPKMLDKYRDQVLYISTFEDTESINLYLSMANKGLSICNADSFSPIKVPNNLFLCVLQTEYMRARMLSIQNLRSGKSVLHYSGTKKLNACGLVLGAFLYRCHAKLGEIVAYVILSDHSVELLGTALSKLILVGLKPDIGITNKCNSMICAFECLFGPSFPVFIDRSSILDQWKRWLASSRHHPPNCFPSPADQCFILDKIRILATTTEVENFAIEKRILLRYCKKKGLDHVNHHYSNKYGLSLEQALKSYNDQNIQRKIPLYDCCEKFWCLVYQKSDSELISSESLSAIGRRHFEELYHHIDMKKGRNVQKFIYQVFDIMKLQCHAAK